jgi:hypothetical protein
MISGGGCRHSPHGWHPPRRMFWPKEVWGRHARALEDFKEPGNAAGAVACLDELVTDALRHAPHCLAYMARLRDPDVFRFCAIPQVMAIGTLALCYDNHSVFTGAPLRNSRSPPTLRPWHMLTAFLRMLQCSCLSRAFYPDSLSASLSAFAPQDMAELQCLYVPMPLSCDCMLPAHRSVSLLFDSERPCCCAFRCGEDATRGNSQVRAGSHLSGRPLQSIRLLRRLSGCQVRTLLCKVVRFMFSPARCAASIAKRRGTGLVALQRIAIQLMTALHIMLQHGLPVVA